MQVSPNYKYSTVSQIAILLVGTIVKGTVSRDLGELLMVKIYESHFLILLEIDYFYWDSVLYHVENFRKHN